MPKDAPTFDIKKYISAIPKKLNKSQKNKILVLIKKSDFETQKNILLLIVEYAIQYDSNYKITPKRIKLPYLGGLDDCSFVLDNFPDSLQLALYNLLKK